MDAPRASLIDRATGEILDIAPGHLCRECARTSYTCCQTAYGVAVTFHDVRRLELSTGRPFHEFTRLLKLPKRTARSLRRDPTFRRLFVGKRRLLQLAQDGPVNCTFLGPEGCTQFEDRPRLCRLHPFWFQPADDGPEVIYDGELDAPAAAASPCLVVTTLWPHLDLSLHAIGESSTTLGEQARRLEAEARWHQAQLDELLEDYRPRELDLELLAPLVAAVRDVEPVSVQYVTMRV